MKLKLNIDIIQKLLPRVKAKAPKAKPSSCLTKSLMLSPKHSLAQFELKPEG